MLFTIAIYIGWEKIQTSSEINLFEEIVLFSPGVHSLLQEKVTTDLMVIRTHEIIKAHSCKETIAVNTAAAIIAGKLFFWRRC